MQAVSRSLGIKVTSARYVQPSYKSSMTRSRMATLFFKGRCWSFQHEPESRSSATGKGFPFQSAEPRLARIAGTLSSERTCFAC